MTCRGLMTSGSTLWLYALLLILKSIVRRRSQRCHKQHQRTFDDVKDATLHGVKDVPGNCENRIFCFYSMIHQLFHWNRSSDMSKLFVTNWNRGHFRLLSAVGERNRLKWRARAKRVKRLSTRLTIVTATLSNVLPNKANLSSSMFFESTQPY